MSHGRNLCRAILRARNNRYTTLQLYCRARPEVHIQVLDIDSREEIGWSERFRVRVRLMPICSLASSNAARLFATEDMLTWLELPPACMWHF